MTQAITPTASKPFSESLLHFKSGCGSPPAAPTDAEVDGAIGDDAAPLSSEQVECLAIALELADECARSDIECEALGVKSSGYDWYDLQAPPCNYTRDDPAYCLNLLLRADRYFQLRGDTPGFKVHRHEAFPNLIRFESTARTCRHCGCTAGRACEGGCSWVAADLCSACQGKA
jgi:hypothetical protein